MNAARGRCRGEEGLTLVELTVAMAITTLVLSVVMAGVISVIRTDQYLEEDSIALSELRTVMADFTKELRQARVVFPGTGGQTSTARRIYFWVDSNRDSVQQTGERITWELTTSNGEGVLTRRTDAAPSPVIRASELVVGDAFEYKAITTAGEITMAPPNTTLVSIRFKADVSGSHGAPRLVSTKVRMRNAATRF